MAASGSLSSDQSTNDLLRPAPHFDWVDEVEKTLISSELSQTSDNATEGLGDSSFPVDLADPPAFIPPAEEDLVFGSINSQDSDLEMVVGMKEDVAAEFAYRDFCMDTIGGQAIHHFNWLGEPVYQRNSTPAAISLQFQLADPKVLQPRDELRIRSIMKRAVPNIDPVIVDLGPDEANIENLHQSGSDLVRFSTSRCSKFYSPHGWWVHDGEMDEDVAVDDGDVNIYMNDDLISGNGYVRLCNIRCREAWKLESEKLFLDSILDKGRYRQLSKDLSNRLYPKWRKHQVFKSSPLKYSILTEDLDSPSGKAKATLEKIVRSNLNGPKTRRRKDYSQNPLRRSARISAQRARKLSIKIGRE